MSIFVCPICKNEIIKENGSYKCEKAHSFDIAKSGYVNLLTNDKMNSKAPGDSKEMVVSRRDFLLKGYYEPLKEELSKTAKAFTKTENPVYFDAGCGTGYYTKAVAESLSSALVSGVDISKNAVNVSAKYLKGAEFAVASVYDLPLKDESVDLITNVFSPMADREYFRVLKKGGHLLYVVPAPEHLFNLKTLLYEKPYLNAELSDSYEGLTQVKKISVEFDIDLEKSQDILSLFTMTPYFWRTPMGAEEKILATPSLKDKASFYILVFEK